MISLFIWQKNRNFAPEKDINVNYVWKEKKMACLARTTANGY